MGWHSGTRSGVRLAAMIPAIRATPSASPFGTPSPRSSATTSAETMTRPAAVAVRAVTSLPDTSTIRAAPEASTWVSPVAGDSEGSAACDIRSSDPARARRRSPPASTAVVVSDDHDQGVGLRQAADQVRAVPSDRRDLSAVAGHLEDARARTAGGRSETEKPSVSSRSHERSSVRKLAHHPADRRQHEDLERDVRRHRVAGQREDRGVVLADRAEALRLARLHRHLGELHRAEPPEHVLDDVVVALADATARHDQVGADQLVRQRVGQLLRIVGDDADPVGDGVGLAHRSRERERVGVVDRVEAERRTRLAQLAPRREHDDARAAAAPGPTRARSPPGSSPLAARGSCPRRAASRRPGRPRRADGRARRARAPADRHVGATAVGPLDRDDDVGAGRHRCPGHDLDGLTGRQRVGLALPGGRLADDRQPDRRVLAPRRAGRRAGRRSRPSRSCRSSGRSIDERDVLADRQAERLQQRLLVRRERLRRARGSWSGALRRCARGHPSRASAAPVTLTARLVAALTVDRPARSPRCFPASRRHRPGRRRARPRLRRTSSRRATVKTVASRNDGGPCGKRASKSRTSL